MPPALDSVSVRFSEMKLSSSNFPNLKLSHEVCKRLSKRTQADSKWNAPVLSEDGVSRNEMFFSSVPPVRISSPDRSKPCCVVPTCPLLTPPPTSTATLLVFSRCQLGVVRNVTGQYEGCCQIGASRSFMSW